MTYIGRKACGCVVAATVDAPGDAKQVAKDVSRFIREGLKVERITTDEARRVLGSCKHKVKR